MSQVNTPTVTKKKQRGRKPVSNRSFQCVVLEPDKCSSSFNSKAKLSAHHKKCHLHVLCGVCDKLMTFTAWDSTHCKSHPKCSHELPIPCRYDRSLPADWKLTERFPRRFSLWSAPKNTNMGSSTQHVITAQQDSTCALDLSPAILSDAIQLDSVNVFSQLNASVTHRSGDYVSPNNNDVQPRSITSHDDEENMNSHQEEEESSASDREAGETDDAEEDEASDGEEGENDDEGEDEANYKEAYVPLRGPTNTSKFLLLRDVTNLPLTSAQNIAPKLILASDSVRENEVAALESNHAHVAESQALPTPISSKRKRIATISESPTNKSPNSQFSQLWGPSEKPIVSQQKQSLEERPQSNVGFNAELYHQPDSIITLPSVVGEDIQLRVSWVSIHSSKTQVQDCPSMPLNYGSIKSDMELVCQDFKLQANSGILKLWNLMKMSDNRTEFTPMENHIQRSALEFIVRFLHTGEGFSSRDRLVDFLNCHVLEAVDEIIICLIIMSTLTKLTARDIYNIGHKVKSVVDTKLARLLHQCVLWELCRTPHTMPDQNKDLILLMFKLSVKEQCIHDSPLSCYVCENDIRLNALQNSILQEINNGDSSFTRSRCVLHVESACGLRKCFLNRLLQLYMRDPCTNVLLLVFSLNCDPLRKDLDTEFQFILNEGQSERKVTFHVMSSILVSRLPDTVGEIATHCARVQNILSGQRFDLRDLYIFWGFLHSDDRKDGWEDHCSFNHVLLLCVTFGIPNCIRFLYGSDVPKSSRMLMYFVTAYLSTNDNISLSLLCKTALSNSALLTGVSQDLLFEWLSRDGLCMKEIDVYNLAVSYTKMNTAMADHTSKTTIFNKIAKVVRFGIMSTEELELVDQQNLLDRLQIVSFINNAKWRGITEYFMHTSPEFIHPYVPRQPVLTQ